MNAAGASAQRCGWSVSHADSPASDAQPTAKPSSTIAVAKSTSTLLTGRKGSTSAATRPTTTDPTTTTPMPRRRGRRAGAPTVPLSFVVVPPLESMRSHTPSRAATRLQHALVPASGGMARGSHPRAPSGPVIAARGAEFACRERGTR